MGKEIFSMFMLYLIFIIAAALTLVVFGGFAAAMLAV